MPNTSFIVYLVIASWIPRYTLTCVREESWAPVRSKFGSIDRLGLLKMLVLHSAASSTNLFASLVPFNSLMPPFTWRVVFASLALSAATAALYKSQLSTLM